VTDKPLDLAELRRLAADPTRAAMTWALLPALLDLVDERTRERDEARATAAKLNRRAQEAEGALLKPGCPDPRARTLGRALANWAAGMWVRKWEAAAQVIREAMPETMGGYPDLFGPAGGWEAWEERAKKAIMRPEDEARAARALSASAPATGDEAKKEEHQP
jgi:hypothetical protein